MNESCDLINFLSLATPTGNSSQYTLHPASCIPCIPISYTLDTSSTSTGYPTTWVPSERLTKLNLPCLKSGWISKLEVDNPAAHKMARLLAEAICFGVLVEATAPVLGSAGGTHVEREGLAALEGYTTESIKKFGAQAALGSKPMLVLMDTNKYKDGTNLTMHDTGLTVKLGPVATAIMRLKKSDVRLDSCNLPPSALSVICACFLLQDHILS